MKNSILIAILFFLPFVNLQSQSLEEKVKKLEQENEQLRKELAECKSAPFSKLLDNIENQEYLEEPTYSREEFHEIVLPKIKAKSEEKYRVGIKAINQTEVFITFCESITNEMIERSGGYDSLRNRPKGFMDKRIGNKVLLEEGKGKALREKLISIRGDFKEIVEDNPYFIERIILDNVVIDFPKEKYGSWEEYKFENMPLGALMPLISSLKVKAIESEIAILQYLNE